MSRSDSKPTVENPTSKYLEWNSGKESFTYWDKEAQEKKALALPLTDLVYLEDKFTVKGFSEEHMKGIWANEVNSTKKEPLTVRIGDQILAEGLYSDIKEKVRAAGGHFCHSVYCMTGDGEIINFQFYRSSRSGIQTIKKKGDRVSKPWEDGGYAEKYGENNSGFSNFWDNNRDEIITKRFSITEAIEAKNGAVKYNVPWFEITDFDPAQDEEITQKETILLEYLQAKKAQYEDKPETNESVIEVQDENL